ncbi:IclR family transcriptional regulator [Streptomyces sp. NBC_01304]|uniref:IclR family transcriptional regulator n=1 Tax=Streptomyces sp. NBC_01304 TaxID=2903818 RepID=UPI002E0D1293|nr:helix-turn-helix domain-containing protein [Streptomyces sp. NBC_01304]
MTAAPAPSGPQSVDRALEILDAVAGAAHPLTAKALARHLGCALSTVYHLLGPLTARGHLARTADGYTLGPRVPALHQAFRRQLRIGPGIGELLLRVRRATGAEAYFTTYRDGVITVVDSTAPPHTAEPWTPGLELRAHATAHGKALLAALPRAARRRYLDAHGMARLTERTITDAERFEAELDRVRADGVAVSVGEADPAYTCLAATLAGGGEDGAGGAARAVSAQAVSARAVSAQAVSVRAVSVSVPTAEFRRRHGELRAALARAADGRL